MPPLLPIGTWYLKRRCVDRQGSLQRQSGKSVQFVNHCSKNAAMWLLPLMVTIEQDPNTGRFFASSWASTDDATIDTIDWDAANQVLTFLRHSTGSGKKVWEWYYGKVVEGILVGRFTPSEFDHNTPRWPEPPPVGEDLGDGKHSPTPYTNHVTGWHEAYINDRGPFGSSILPRVFEIDHGGLFARLRIDGDQDGRSMLGRLKFYGHPEELEYDLSDVGWDGTFLSFTREDVEKHFSERYAAVVTGIDIYGICNRTDTRSGKRQTSGWQGTRAEVLTYGLTPKQPIERSEWQDRTRKQLIHLMMAGNPQPDVGGPTQRTPVGPLRDGTEGQNRDDDWTHHPQDYRRQELFFEYTLVDPWSGRLIDRRSHAWLLLPNVDDSAPRRALLSLNGHHGSAWKMTDPGSLHYWYGESFARRGYVVLALDISHRNDSPLYSDDYTGGDDADHGNGAHPSIKAPGDYASDWEEDGERAWDAMRALDYLRRRPEVDPNCILVTGLSMGGEITTIVGALDPRLGMVIPSGFSPDASIMMRRGHCWHWLNADTREYIDTSDYQALVAPRPLIVESSKTDQTYSHFHRPFATDKQVVRRTAVAYADVPERLIHYLHDDRGTDTDSDDVNGGHQYRIGDFNPKHHNQERGVRRTVVTEPQSPPGTPGALDWQTNDQTDDTPLLPELAGYIHPTVFDYVDQLLCPNPLE